MAKESDRDRRLRVIQSLEIEESWGYRARDALCALLRELVEDVETLRTGATHGEGEEARQGLDADRRPDPTANGGGPGGSPTGPDIDGLAAVPQGVANEAGEGGDGN